MGARGSAFTCLAGLALGFVCIDGKQGSSVLQALLGMTTDRLTRPVLSFRRACCSGLGTGFKPPIQY